MKKILIGIPDYANECPSARKRLLEEGYTLIENPHPQPFSMDEIMEYILEIDGVVAGGEVWNEQIYRYAPRLKIISRFGVGYDSVDIVKAKEYGILVTNVRNGMLANGVAEYAVTLMLSVAKNIVPMDRETRCGNWTRITGGQLYGKTIGIVGFGAIGRQVAKMLAGFNVKILAYDEYPDAAAAKELNVEFASKDRILELSDVITLHIPGSSGNYHFIGEQELKKMKSSAYLINTARGSVVDIDALYEGLASKEIAGAGIDVYETEPPGKGLHLYGMDNVIVVPHAASENRESKEAVGLDSAQAVIDVLKGKTPKNVLNP